MNGQDCFCGNELSREDLDSDRMCNTYCVGDGDMTEEWGGADRQSV